jgi:hypothetical protein
MKHTLTTKVCFLLLLPHPYVLYVLHFLYDKKDVIMMTYTLSQQKISAPVIISEYALLILVMDHNCE